MITKSRMARLARKIATIYHSLNKIVDEEEASADIYDSLIDGYVYELFEDLATEFAEYIRRKTDGN